MEPMADEQISLILDLLRELGAKTDGIAADQTAARAEMASMRADQTAARAEMASMRADQTATRTDMASMRAEMASMRADITRIDAKLDRAAARADDVMASQVRLKTDIAVIRAMQEEHTRILMGGLRQELDSLRERVDALERRD